MKPEFEEYAQNLAEKINQVEKKIDPKIMNYKDHCCEIVREAIPYELANFIYNYILLKRDAVEYLYSNNVIQENSLFGTWKDQQIPNTYSHYADMVMETLLMKLLPKMREITGLNLIPSYVKTIDNNPDAIKLITEISSKGIYKFL